MIPSDTVPIANNDAILHELVDLLSRRVYLGSFQWTSESTVLNRTFPYAYYLNGTKSWLYQTSFPNDLFAKSPILRDKLSHFQFLKADVGLEVKVNATPFQSGALAVVYNPYVNKLSKFRRDSTQCLPSLTSNPSYTMYLEVENSKEIVMPYASEFDMFDLSSSDTQFGVFEIYALSQLKGASDNESVTVSVFGKLVDPIVKTATNSNYLVSETKGVREMTDEELKTFALSRGFTVQSESSSHTLSGVATAIGNVGSAMSEVPVVGAFARTVGWIGHTVGKVASAIGFSKATATNMVEFVVPQPGRFMGNTQGQDSSNTLALIPDNAVNPTGLMPSPVDEMIFKHIKAVQAIVYTLTVAKEAFVESNLLFSFKVHPLEFAHTVDDDLEYFHFTAFQHIVSMFRFWRGSLDYELAVVKTIYHSGRFVIVYYPNSLPSATLTTELNTNYNLIVDLNKKGVITDFSTKFNVPYVGTTTHRAVWGASQAALEENVQNPSIGVYALTNLVCPETVAQSVDFVLSLNGGSDFSVAQPFLKTQAGYSPPAISFLTAQINENCTYGTQVQMFENGITNDAEIYTSVFGEMFQSVRALMKKFRKFMVISDDHTLVYSPQSFGNDDLTGCRTIGGVPLPETFLSMPTYIYRFWAGGFRVKGFVTSIQGTISYGDSSSDSSLTFQEDESNSVQQFNVEFAQAANINNIVEITSPYYATRRCRAMSYPRDSSVVGHISENDPLNKVCLECKATDNVHYYEAASDDFNPFFIVGPPVMCIAATGIQTFSTASPPVPLPYGDLDPSLLTRTSSGVIYAGSVLVLQSIELVDASLPASVSLSTEANHDVWDGLTFTNFSAVINANATVSLVNATSATFMRFDTTNTGTKAEVTEFSASDPGYLTHDSSQNFIVLSSFDAPAEGTAQMSLVSTATETIDVAAPPRLLYPGTINTTNLWNAPAGVVNTSDLGTYKYYQVTVVSA